MTIKLLEIQDQTVVIVSQIKIKAQEKPRRDSLSQHTDLITKLHIMKSREQDLKTCQGQMVC